MFVIYDAALTLLISSGLRELGQEENLKHTYHRGLQDQLPVGPKSVKKILATTGDDLSPKTKLPGLILVSMDKETVLKFCSPAKLDGVSESEVLTSGTDFRIHTTFGEDEVATGRADRAAATVKSVEFRGGRAIRRRTKAALPEMLVDSSPVCQ